MKFITQHITPRRSYVALALLLVFAVGQGLYYISGSQAGTNTYTADNSDFPNPERGFSQQGGDGTKARAANMSLIHEYFRLDAFKSAPLSSDYLASVSATFDRARAAGVKVVPRFTYNFPSTYPINPAVDGDAPISLVQTHIDQLTPILQQNSDIIAFFEAGFIGAWGEWHSSTNNLTTTANKTLVLNKLLAALPSSRAVTLRYQRDKKAIFSDTNPISSAQAFTGSNFSRVGSYNDCFLASADDWGTYDLNTTPTLQQQKDYLNIQNQYVPQGGETCNFGADAQPFIGCNAAMADLAYQRWSQLNSEYEPGVLNLWKQQGCYSLIAQRLGYRFRLLSATLSQQLHPGGTFTANIQLTNDGFAAPYNPRGLELILRNISTKQEFVLPLSSDPRRWSPGNTQTLSVTAGLPASMPTGTYASFINLPDPAPSLYGRPEYSIRLANTNVWESATGYNALSLNVAVSATGTDPAYTGANFFKSRGAAASGPADINGDGKVNVLDLSRLLSSWGTNSVADLNRNGIVDIIDLSMLLSKWTG